MFVGFIAVVVILLVVVGLMSTGATNGSGGVDQTKATKAVSEISALAQSTGFYKTTTTNSDYTGLNVDTLVSSGIVDSADIYTTVAADNVKDSTATQVVAGTKLVKSKAVKGMFYNIAVNSTSAKNFDLTACVDTDDIGATSTLAAALEKNYEKFSGSAAINTGTGALAKDGSAVITF